MQILISKGWQDYQLLDSGNGMRLEQFGPYLTARPDPQAIWKPSLSEKEWLDADVRYIRTQNDKGIWKFKRHIPEKWKMSYKNLSFWARLTSFKHTGVFPEQSLQWDFIDEQIKKNIKSYSSNEMRSSQPSVSNNKEETHTRGGIKFSERALAPANSMGVKNNFAQPSEENFNSDLSTPQVLNLFGYTGIASLAAAESGAKVTHVDASKPSITWARDNQDLSKLNDKPIRWILDDAVKFVEREIKRGNTYDGVIMDPPVYGHGPTGQIWKFNENFPRLMENVSKILSKNPLFVIVNAYAISSSALMLENVMEDFLPKGRIEVGELCLEEKTSKRLLSTGIFARWSK
ncbi:MAG TPA: class I SAM-dependent methyltransferase [Patescibacteria group bacterium]